MDKKRSVEIFSAGCEICNDTIEHVQQLACPTCEVTILNIGDVKVAKRARELGVERLPAVVIDGKLAECCTGNGIIDDVLKKEGIGQP